MTRPNIILRIVIPAVLIAAIVFSLFGRLLAASLLADNVAVTYCGGKWTTDRVYVWPCVVYRNGFDP